MRWFRLFGILIFVYILGRLNWVDVRSVFGELRWPFLVSAIMIVPFLVLTKASRWYWLVRQQGIDYGYRAAVVTYLCGLYLGFITPGRLGDLVKAFYLKREAGEPLASCFANVVFDRLLDLVFLITIGTLALVYFFYAFLSFWSLLLPLGLLVSLALVFLDKRLGNYLLHLLFNKLQLASTHYGAVQLSFDRFHDGIGRLLSQSGRAVAFTFFAYALFFGTSYLIALSLNIEIAFLPFVFIVSLSSLSTFLPISFSGLGTREAVFITIFYQLGLNKELAVSYTTLSLVVFNLLIGLSGLIAWQLKGDKKVV